MQNIAFIPLLLNNTSGFIHPLNWPAQPDVLSSALPRPICLSWFTFVSSDWEPSKADGLPMAFLCITRVTLCSQPLQLL